MLRGSHIFWVRILVLPLLDCVTWTRYLFGMMSFYYSVIAVMITQGTEKEKW
ncbi:unnamed protein product [Nyctereutes procyonoides]|uniref:(raccoon dog) hypothetical protein n=1 Tax=Nyctereutes procyonoides TaxID=34880 RepID=A0A811Y373_NYCPR|nr:unnamed protein product [Nyctereutes procyonoides]